jgi:Tfp pilus assembly protein PilX
MWKLRTKATKARRATGERGNIVIVLMVIFVLVTISAALLSRVIGNQSIVGTRQDTATAVSGADGGIADALFQLDQLQTDPGAGTKITCTNSSPSDAKCGAPGVSYIATEVNSAMWQIQAHGTINGKQGAVQELVTRASKYPFGLFGNTSLNFNGNTSNGASFFTYNPVPAASGTNPDPNGGVSVGTNGTITCTQSLGSNVTPMYYATGGIGSLSTACGPSPQGYNYVYYLPPVLKPANASGCPGLFDSGTNTWQFGSGFPGAPTSLSPGAYLCQQRISINGSLTVQGQVSLTVWLDPAFYNSSTNAITIVGNSYVNDIADYCADSATNHTACPAPPISLPDAANLQIFTNSNGSVGNDNGQGYDFGGILYAPNASLTQDGCKSQYYGSVVIGALVCNGGPHLMIKYDSALSTMYGAWQPASYTQINP